MAVAITPRISAQTIYQDVNPNEYLFPAFCLKQNGDYLMMARKAPGHQIPPGTIVARTSTTGLAGSWSAEATVYAPPGSRNAAAGIPRLIPDGSGRIAAQVWYDDADTSPPYVSTTFVSTDETATAWVRGGDLPDVFGVGALGGNPTESPIVFMPDGSWIVASYSPEIATSKWSAVVFRSTDEGDTWTFLSYIDRAGSTTVFEEPFLLLLQSGDVLASVRVTEAGGGRYTHIYRSTDDAATWTDEGRVTSTWESGSRAALLQTSGGTIILHHRLITSGGASGRGVYHFSADDAATWSVGNELDSNTTPPTAAGPPVYSYGDIVEISGGVAMLWADETPISGSGSAIQFKTYDVTGEPTTPAEGYGNTVSSGYGEATAEADEGALLVLPESSAWEQVGAAIFVRTANEPNSVEATVSGTAGGLLRFRGTDSSLFDASLDGTTWASAVDVPPGTSTVHLRVTPVTAGSTLSAEVGVPV